MRTRVYTASNGLSQIHTYGGGPANTRDHWDNLAFDPITEFSHGHHARAGGGNDTFNLQNLDNVSAVVVGRLEDFGPSRDEIRLDGVLLDLDNPPDNVRIVAFNGGHNDDGAAPQPWLLVATAAGGYVFYALEGARIDMDGDGGSNGGNHENHFLSEGMVPDFAALPDIRFTDNHNLVPDGLAPDGGVIVNDIDGNAADVLERVTGTEDGDLIAAGLNDDSVEGRGGHDVIWGGSGNDSVDGGSGADRLEGNDGGDRLDGGAGADTLDGGAGDDLLRGGIDFDTLSGGSGADLLIAGNGRDVSHGGAGNDVLQDNGQRGWLGGDRLHGGSGADTLYAGGGSDTLHGDGGNDRLYGGLDGDVIYGGFNFDDLFGQHGNDTLFGGNGRDRLHGGDGDDVLRDNGQSGHYGGDRMFGGRGDDALHIGGGDDTASGGAGEDTFVFFGNHGNDVITDFDAAAAGEVIDLSAIAAIADMSDLRAAATQTGQDVLIDTGSGNSILLQDVSRADLGADDFIFA